MIKTFRARVVAGVLQLEERVDLPDGTVVDVTVDTPVPSTEKTGKPYSAIEALINANIEGPPDWSANIDHYLYGTEREEE